MKRKPPVTLTRNLPEGRTFYLDATNLFDYHDRDGLLDETFTWSDFLKPYFPSITHFYVMPWGSNGPVFTVVVRSAEDFMVEILSVDGATMYQFTEENFNLICEPASVVSVSKSSYYSHLQFISEGLEPVDG